MELCFCSVIPMLLVYCPESYGLQTWDPAGTGDYLLDADAWASGTLSRKLPHIQDSTPVDSCSPNHTPSPTGSTWSLGSGTCLPLGGHISCTCSETPTRTRDRSSSSSLCIHHSEQLGSDSEDQESEGSGSHQACLLVGEKDGEADTTMSECSDKSSCEESSSETESIEAPASKVAKSVTVESDSENNGSSLDSDSSGTIPTVPTPKKETTEVLETKPSMAQSSSLPFLDQNLLEGQ